MTPRPHPADATHPNRATFPTGLSGPALRALHTAGIRSVDELTRLTERDLAALHGMGPKGIVVLRDALRARGLEFRRS
jgi:DNA-directed RNA polymerase alpha subunit